MTLAFILFWFWSWIRKILAVSKGTNFGRGTAFRCVVCLIPLTYYPKNMTPLTRYIILKLTCLAFWSVCIKNLGSKSWKWGLTACRNSNGLVITNGYVAHLCQKGIYFSRPTRACAYTHTHARARAGANTYTHTQPKHKQTHIQAQQRQTANVWSYCRGGLS